MKTLITVILLSLSACIPDPPVNPTTEGYPWTAQAQEDVRAFVGEMMDWHPTSAPPIVWMEGRCLEYDVYTGKRQAPCYIGEFNPWLDPPTIYLIDKWGTVADSALAHELFHAWSREVMGYMDKDHDGDVWALEDLAQARIWEWESTFRQPRNRPPSTERHPCPLATEQNP